MTSLNAVEQDAAKILEFHGFNEENYNLMVEDMNLCHKGKYSRSVRREMFKTILESSPKKQEIWEDIKFRRTAEVKQNLESVMTDAMVEKVIAEHDHYDECAVKYWFYHLYPSYSPNEIEERHLAAISSIAQREIDQYEHSDELSVIGEHWMEYYEFNWPDCEVESARDLFRSMTELLYVGLTARMCIKTLQNIYSDRNPVKLRIAKKLETEKSPIDVDELRKALEKVRRKYKLDEGSKGEEQALVKELFMNNWDEFTIGEIKEQAASFYADEVGTCRLDEEDVAESHVVEIDSQDSYVSEDDDSAESDENALS